MLQQLYEVSLEFLKNAGKTLAETSREVAGSVARKIPAETADKVKDLYRNNKEIVISVSVAAAVYLIMRKKEPTKFEPRDVPKTKSERKSMIKSFISEHS